MAFIDFGGGIGGIFGGGISGSTGRAFSSAFRQTSGGQAPLLKPVQPPRRVRRRANDPFDFFGTLFTTPQTLPLNPIAALNQMI